MYIGYDSLLSEMMNHYFEDEHRLAWKRELDIKTQLIKTTAIDDYLVHLIEGYINVTIEERLEKYLMELIKDDWFHQWPSIRWAYATRLLYSDKATEDEINLALSILLPLSKNGHPGAMCDIGYCYCYGLGVERSYERAMCLWITSSLKGYSKANEFLVVESELTRSKSLTDEISFFLADRVFCAFIEEYKVPVENKTFILDSYSKAIQQRGKELFHKYQKLLKAVNNKTLLRHTGELCWGKSENPYSISIKLRQRGEKYGMVE